MAACPRCGAEVTDATIEQQPDSGYAPSRTITLVPCGHLAGVITVVRDEHGDRIVEVWT